MNSLANNKWNIGNVEIHQIVELSNAGKIIQESISKATPELIKEISWIKPTYANEYGELFAHVQTFLIKDGDTVLLVDTCNGNDKNRVDLPEWGQLQTNFLEKLSASGVQPNEVDYVICTHLHFDHVGWNTILKDGVWVPTFPNARYLFSKEEFEYWDGMPEKEIEDDRQGIIDSVRPIINAGLADLVEVTHKVNNQISFIPTPGHTPHHVSIKIESNGEKAIISGDFIHHPCQLAYPEWDTVADTYPEQCVKTRKDLLESIKDKDIKLIGSHFSNPPIGNVVSDGDAFRFEF